MSSSTVTKNIKYRPGRLEDEPLIKKIMIRQLMNPLSIRYQNFIVAVPFDGGSNVKDEKGICGFAQIRPLGEKGFDPNIIDSAPGSGSDVLETLKGDTYEDIWEEFEDNTLDFPNGFGSLPWSKEYQLYARKSKEMRENNLNRFKNVDEYVAKQRQQKKGNNYNSNFLWELASVYVDPKWRNQGIGSELIQKVISKHIMLGRKVDDIYLLTIDDKIGWYQKLGFGITVNPPKYMKLEIMAGSLIVKLISDGSKNLVCMKALSKRVSGNNNIEIGSSS